MRQLGKWQNIICFIFLFILKLYWCTHTLLFNRLVIDELVGNYWVVNMDLNLDGHMDILALAYSGEGLVWYKNPGTRGGIWIKSLISPLPNVVALDDAGDLNGDGYTPDLVLAYNFTIPGTDGSTSVSGGTAVWLENPGPANLSKPWTAHFMGYSPSLHRILYSPNLNDGKGAAVLAPLLGSMPLPPDYLNEASQLGLLIRPDDVYSTWEYVPLSLSTPLHAVHAFVRAPDGDVPGLPLSLLVGAQEGLFSIKIDEFSYSVNQTLLVSGAPLYSYSPYSGVNGVGVCSLTNGQTYMATIGPWEGVNLLTPPTIQIHELSQFGFVTKTLTIQGPQGHVVVCGDFDNDGNDEFLVGLRGPVKSIQMYHIPDLTNEDFSWWDIDLDANEGASGLAVHDYDKDGKLDFVATGFPGFNVNPAGQFADKFVAIYWQQ
jgi:hypothetical protein